MVLNKTIYFWRTDLNQLMSYYEQKKININNLLLYLFLFFIFLNISCYWFAMVTAFPELVFGTTFNYYFKVQFPVGILGALFDSLSFFVTIYIIRRALKTKENFEFITHLSIDFIIAILATFWILFVFIISGWIVGFFETLEQSIVVIKTYEHETNLSQRTEVYTGMLEDAIIHPFRNIQNIYFGLLMGLSAILPTVIHLSMFCYSLIKTVKNKNLIFQ